MHIYEILKRPVVTEKSVGMASVDNKYTFEVDMRANKMLVADAVATAFNVAVEAVHISVMPAKTRRTRRGVAVRKPKWKKAIVQLAPGNSIQLFEGVV
jgi:large subunit ribosomal protein L23